MSEGFIALPLERTIGVSPSDFCTHLPTLAPRFPCKINDGGKRFSFFSVPPTLFDIKTFSAAYHIALRSVKNTITFSVYSPIFFACSCKVIR